MFKKGQRLKSGLWDISRAHFYGKPKRTIYVELPEEDKTPGREECGLLTKSMYGTQDAPAIWQAHYTGILESAGFKRGRSNASVLHREADGVRVVVHGDDFLALGDHSGLDELDALLRTSYKLKRLGTLGDEEADDNPGITLDYCSTPATKNPQGTTGARSMSRAGSVRETQEIHCPGSFGCFQKQGYPQIISFNRVFHCKLSILGYPYFGKHPFILGKC